MFEDWWATQEMCQMQVYSLLQSRVPERALEDTQEGLQSPGEDHHCGEPYTSCKHRRRIHQHRKQHLLHDRPEKKVYRLLVDVVRMRREDTYTFEGDTMPGTIYNGESSSESAFRRMIRRAKSKTELLPPWWNDSKLEECIRLNRQAPQCAQEKSDIQESWGDNMMPMKLRMLGEKIYGNAKGTMPGQGDRMLNLQMMLERGDSGMVSSHLGLR